ncbi:hypothetical protein LUZ63_005563 [Rhynchospora breviuscula]|uniref:Dirigent protein n=1 Tax=Rhynchospora breviuscula TaxID=2022672 RepID=A0A9Q0CNC3_9POAL|nr:hypothetical protein LUZ63_005563 [Rhynchospora breviuscula]
MVSSLSQTVLFSILLFLSLHQACAKKTHLNFYFHVTDVQANATDYGTIIVMDQALREGLDENSTLIGRVQGIQAAVGKDGSLETMFNFLFLNKQYNGSTLAIYGRAPLGTTIERPVIGGTGKFRMSKGYSLAKPVILSATRLVYELDVYVWHLGLKDD